MNRILKIVLLLAVPATPAAAQDASKQLQDCRVIQNMAARLFCYDGVVDAQSRSNAVAPPAAAPVLPPVATAPAVTVPVPRAAAPAPRSPVPPVVAPPTQKAAVLPSAPDIARFGEDDLRPEKRQPQTRTVPDEMAAKITAVRNDPYGAAIMTLDNGQTWRQTEGSPYRAAIGAPVVIKKGVLGAYFLTTPSGGRSVKVRRVD